MAERKVSFLMDVDNPTQAGLICRINIILLYILNWLRQPKTDWFSIPDTGAGEVTAAAEVKDKTVKAVGGQRFDVQI